jgi:hypothetical protein
MDGKRIVQQAFDAQRERDRHSTGTGLSIEQVTAIWNSVSIEGHSPGPVEGREIVRQALGVGGLGRGLLPDEEIVLFSSYSMLGLWTLFIPKVGDGTRPTDGPTEDPPEDPPEDTPPDGPGVPGSPYGGGPDDPGTFTPPWGEGPNFWEPPRGTGLLNDFGCSGTTATEVMIGTMSCNFTNPGYECVYLVNSDCEGRCECLPVSEDPGPYTGPEEPEDPDGPDTGDSGDTS